VKRVVAVSIRKNGSPNSEF